LPCTWPTFRRATPALTESNFTPWGCGSSGISALNDNDLSQFSLSLPNSSWTLTANLNTTLSSGGYDITDIKTISGWNVDYVDQNYQLSYSTVSAPLVFLPLGTYSLNNTNTSWTSEADSPTTLQIDLAGTHGGVIAADIAALQFQFSAATSTYGHSTAYREIEVFGKAVPEPGSLVLFGLGALGLFAVACRRRAA